MGAPIRYSRRSTAKRWISWGLSRFRSCEERGTWAPGMCQTHESKIWKQFCIHRWTEIFGQQQANKGHSFAFSDLPKDIMTNANISKLCVLHLVWVTHMKRAFRLLDWKSYEGTLTLISVSAGASVTVCKWDAPMLTHCSSLCKHYIDKLGEGKVNNYGTTCHGKLHSLTKLCFFWALVLCYYAE